MGMCRPRRSLIVRREVSVATASQWSELRGFRLRQRRSTGWSQPWVVCVTLTLSLHSFFGPGHGLYDWAGVPSAAPVGSTVMDFQRSTGLSMRRRLNTWLGMVSTSGRRTNCFVRSLTRSASRCETRTSWIHCLQGLATSWAMYACMSGLKCISGLSRIRCRSLGICVRLPGWAAHIYAWTHRFVFAGLELLSFEMVQCLNGLVMAIFKVSRERVVTHALENAEFTGKRKRL